MSSLAEAQQILTVLAEIESTLDRVEDQLSSGEIEAKQAAVTYTDLHNIMQDVFFLARQMGLPPELNAAISALQRVIILMNQARIAIAAFQLSTGPVGWAIFGFSVASMAVSTYSLAESLDQEMRR